MWNTMEERNLTTKSGKLESKGESYSIPIASVDPSLGTRIPSGNAELDRVLGGGFMRGSAVLLGGEPGIGKSTLLLQVAAGIQSRGRVLYVSGEESPGQLRLRADRLAALRDNLEILCSSDLDRILATFEAVRPVFIVIDSVQTVYSAEAGAVPGTANQVKFCTMEMTEWAKNHDAVIVLVAHVTKDGMIAGPKAAEHIVDAVLAFEQAEGDLRALRASKNRFGSTDELGLFRMGEKGLSELSDPTGVLLVRRDGAIPPGVAVTIVYEGSRVLLVEVQALAVEAKAGFTRVYSDRIDSSRVARIAAVIEKQTGIELARHDIYINVAGGVRLAEPGIDLALAAAILSARTDQPLPAGAALAGELSLAGEVRPVRQMERRAKAARGLGFSRVLGPKAHAPGEASSGASGDTSGGAGVRPSGSSRPSWKGVETLGATIRELWSGS